MRAWIRVLLCLFWAIFLTPVYAQGVITPDTRAIAITVEGGIEAKARLDGTYGISEDREISLHKTVKLRVNQWGYAALSLDIASAFQKAGLYPGVEINAFAYCSDCSGGGQCIDISGELEVGKLSLPIRFGKMSLSEALRDMRPKRTADLARVEILRAGKTLIIDATQKAGEETELKNHDIIFVPAKK